MTPDTQVEVRFFAADVSCCICLVSRLAGRVEPRYQGLVLLFVLLSINVSHCSTAVVSGKCTAFLTVEL